MAPVSTKSRIEVGQDIVLPVGRNRLRGKVVEDRGNLGVNKERILRVALDMGEDVPPREHEVPESRLEPLSSSAKG